MLRTANKQLQPQGKLKYVIKDIEGCFPNMPKDAIRTSMKTVLEEMDRRTVRVGRVFLSREHKTVDAHDKHHGVIKAESGSRPLFCSRHRYVLLRQCDLVETQRRIASTEAGNPHGGPSVPRDDNCGVRMDGTHVADWTSTSPLLLWVLPTPTPLLSRLLRGAGADASTLRGTCEARAMERARADRPWTAWAGTHHIPSLLSLEKNSRRGGCECECENEHPRLHRPCCSKLP